MGTLAAKLLVWMAVAAQAVAPAITPRVCFCALRGAVCACCSGSGGCRHQVASTRNSSNAAARWGDAASPASRTTAPIGCPHCGDSKQLRVAHVAASTPGGHTAGVDAGRGASRLTCCLMTDEGGETCGSGRCLCHLRTTAEPALSTQGTNLTLPEFGLVAGHSQPGPATLVSVGPTSLGPFLHHSSGERLHVLYCVWLI